MSKGIIYNLFSRIIFILGAYIIHIYIARLLGPDLYGVFGVCIAIITICYVFLNNGVRQIVSKSSAKFPEGAQYFLKKGLTVQLAMAVILGFTIIVFAQNIASLFNDSDLVKPLYLTGIIITIQSLYFVFTGVLNGLKKFGYENAVLSTYGFTRAAGAILLVYLGFEVMGALTGFLTASITAVILGIILTWNLGNKKYHTIKIRTILKSSIPIMIIFGGITFIMNFDLLSIKHFLSSGQYSGYYTSAAAISKLSYWFLFAFGSVVLPFISTGLYKNNGQQIKKYVVGTIRYSLLSILPIAVLFFIYSEEIVTFVYGNNYEPAGKILGALIWGLISLGLLSIFSHIMIGIDKENIMVRYSLLGIIICFFLNITLVPRFGMIGGAISTTLAGSFVALITYIYINRYLEININKASIVKTLLALLVLLPISFFINELNMSFIFKAIVLYFIYCVFLLGSKEIKREDRDKLRNLIFNFFTNN